jgi:hypothetical protein
MVGNSTSRLLVGLPILVAHFVLAFGLSNLVFWLYFDAGVKWTTDPVVPQIQAMLALIGQLAAAVILVSAVVLAKWRGCLSTTIAGLWPLVLAGLPFLMPNVFMWIILAIVLIACGLAGAMNVTADQRA